jgi:DNA-binding NtrC family response regulator
MAARILIVDDDPALRRALERVLRAFDLTTAETAADAMRILAGGAFDVILTDYGIPATDGVTLLREVEAAHPSVRRYLMTGFDATRFEVHMASKLVRRIFPKPIDLDALRLELSGTDAP